MYKLLIEDDEGGKTAVSLVRDEITIGRKEGNTIRLTDRNVSRRHGRIVRDDDRIYIEDVAARYGIKKNGKKIDERAELQEGDTVLIGDYRLTLKPEKKAKKGKEDGAKKKPKPPKKPKASDDFSSQEREQTQIMQAMPAKLVVISSNFAGKEFPLTLEEMVIGRGDDCNIIIDHRSISGRHAKIVREDNTTYKIVDLNSKNGVRVSDETYRATLLKRGDVIELGHVKFRFVEPGENYVFDPDAVEKSVPEAPVVADAGMDTKKMGLILAGVVAAVLVVGALVVIPGDDDEVEDVGDDPGELMAEMGDLEGDDADDRIQDNIDEARSQIEQGELDAPIQRLELVQEFDPSVEQREEIDELLSMARRERVPKQHYEQAISDLEDGQPLSALEEATSISSQSLFHARIEEEGIVYDIFDALLAEGYEALEDEEFDQAREMADEVLMAGMDYEPAVDLMEEADEREQEYEIAMAEQQQQQQAAATPPSSSGNNGGSELQPLPGDSSPSPPPSEPSVSAEEAREMYTQAARQVAGGNPQEAINICTEALDAGHSPCHRILGLAYGRLDDSSNACSHFQQYLAGGGSPGPVTSHMENHGCPP